MPRLGDRQFRLLAEFERQAPALTPVSTADLLAPFLPLWTRTSLLDSLLGLERHKLVSRGRKEEAACWRITQAGQTALDAARKAHARADAEEARILASDEQAAYERENQ